MRYRQLANTSMEISEIGFGAAPLGEEYGAIDPAEGQRAVQCAIDLGINYFDVAPYYGATLAETRLGQALAGRRQSVVLATKVGRYKTAVSERFDFSAARVRSSLEESLRRLKTDYVDVYQAHDIEFASRAQIAEETLPAMHRLKEEGKARFIGITAYPLQLLRDVAETAPVDAILTYCRYNLLDTAMDEVLAPLTRDEDIALINGSPLHMGALTEKGAPAWHPAPKRVLEMAQKAARLCSSRRANIAEIALQFALANQYVSTTLIGMSKVRHVARALDLLGAPVNRQLIDEVLELIKPVANVCWQEGRPENHDPGAVPQQS